jgi:hypothetical protein
VLSRNRETEVDGLELPAPHDVGCEVEPLVEERRQLRLGSVRGMVVELDVRDHRDLGPKEADRAVGLVPLDDEPALPGTRVPTELRHDASDDPRGIVAELPQHERDHGGRRRLPVGPAHDDGATEPDELGEELRAGTALHPAGVGRRDDHLEPGGRVRLAANIGRYPLKGLEKDRLANIPAPHLGAPLPGEVRIRGEAGASDADEVDRAALQGTRDLPSHLPAPPSRAG